MAYRALLDANVLYPFSLRDTLLRLAEVELYDCVWSDRILVEATNALVRKRQMDGARADRMRRLLTKTFEDASVPEDAIARLESSMTNDAKDRHVLAAAVAGGAEGLVTFNLKHFPEGACAPFGIDPRHPDEFLLSLNDLDPDLVSRVIDEQARDLRHPPMTRDEVLARLARVVPAFTDMLR